ncbi:hypothetical protein [Pyramidobacter porci]
MSRITARRYLEYLVAAGEATLELEYQKVGRPRSLSVRLRSYTVS